ncbi:hypothetical protein [Cytobacillus oceanisediminis]|uniref:hypothetical protein n=1 Tax=Cytobacillus oceanisediminis TaxID=665099 RepID=UPI000FB515F2|nr:hypothetical protein [Cytobacillus oceanisediminis]MDK7667410.1 hypothetical protein [Cytobacillus oceanisediminis]
MGIVCNMTSTLKAESFTSQFKTLLNQCKTRTDFFNLLQWVVRFYAEPQNEKEHMVFSILSVIYQDCPEAFVDYVKDMDALEWQFITDAKIMFENNYFEQSKMDEWRDKVLKDNSPSSVKNTLKKGTVIDFKRIKEV